MQTFMYRLFKLANSNYTGKPAATVPEFLELGVKMLPQYIKNPADLRQAQLGLAESMYENGDLDEHRKFYCKPRQCESCRRYSVRGGVGSFLGNIAYLQGDNGPSGKRLLRTRLIWRANPECRRHVRVWSQIFFAWNRDNNGYRSDENVGFSGAR